MCVVKNVVFWGFFYLLWQKFEPTRVQGLDYASRTLVWQLTRVV